MIKLFCGLYEVLVPKHRPISCKTLLTITLDIVNGPNPLVPKQTLIHNIHDFSLRSVNVLYRFPCHKVLQGDSIVWFASYMVVYGAINLSVCIFYQVNKTQSISLQDASTGCGYQISVFDMTACPLTYSGRTLTCPKSTMS